MKKMEFTYMAFFKEHLTNFVPYDVFLNFKVFFYTQISEIQSQENIFCIEN